MKSHKSAVRKVAAPFPPQPESVRSDFGEAEIVTQLTGAPLPNAPALRALPQSLTALAHHGYSQDEIHMLVVPKRTLARRTAQNEPLSVEETDKALRLERVAGRAAAVFGNPDKANRWMRKPKHQLGGKTPLAFLSSEAGARTVEEMLVRIEYGMLA
jgi:putative toxin-antitoxin system antitoxin component (TIGR02293 family)